MYRPLLLAAGLLLAAASPTNAAAPEPLKKLYVVLAFDTADDDLKPSLLQDEKRVRTLLRVTIPKAHYEVVQTLKGDDVTAEKLLGAVKELKKKVTADDSVLFYYGGHGAVNEKFGHVLKMTNGPDLARSRLRKDLEALKPGLLVMLTDCCSTKEKHDGKTEVVAGDRDSDGIHPTVRHLFFQARGVVDVTAATADEAAWSDDKNGGLFTRSLARMLTKTPKELTGGDDAVVTWQRFFPLLQGDTQRFFVDWSAAMRARYPDAKIRAERQKPHAFALGETASHAVLTLENIKGETLRYKYRWGQDPDAPWTDGELEPGETRTHTAVVPKGTNADDLPKLEIEREGAGRVDRLRAKLWDKDTPPKTLGQLYRIKR